MNSPARPQTEPPARETGAGTLDAFFVPQTVAVIGASPKDGSVGRTLLENLYEYGGQVFPVNPKHRVILRIPAFRHVADVPAKVDLAVIATPASTVPGIVRECARAGVKAAIIHSAGFRECGEAGAERERQVLHEARQGNLRLLGPNCLGVMLPHRRLNATFARTMARPGNVAFISQSGALCTAVLDWSLRENVGFSALVSVGSMLDVGWGDLIDTLGADPHTRSIVIYMESIGDARAFLSAAREVAFTKPIIVVKAGRTEAAARAAASHTGTLTGSDAVLDAAFGRVGVLRVDKLEDLFDLAEALGKQPRPRGRRLGIVSNAGGPGALAVDRLVLGGGEAATLAPETIRELDRLLPPHWSRGNPVDILGDADDRRYVKAVELVANDSTTDGVLVILTPQTMSDALGTAEKIKTLAAAMKGKPLLASWMGGTAVEAGEAVLNAAGIPTFKFPDRASQAFNYMWRYSANLKALYETPALLEAEKSAGGIASAAAIISAARQERRVILTEHESRQILAAYDIPVVAAHPAATADEAVAAAAQLGFPVVLKLHSETITHKSDVGGVRLNLRDDAEVREAWTAIRRAVTQKAGEEHFKGVMVERMISGDGFELILGSSIDAQFGPVLLFGAGGRAVEAIADRAVGLPPLTSVLARRLMERTRIYAALRENRGGAPIDLPALEQTLVRFSQLVAEQHWIKEIDINPLFVSAGQIVALDARMILHDPAVTEEQLPVPAIRPYPQQYTSAGTLADGTPVLIRAIRPEDEPMMVRFHQMLSDESVYYRYFTPLSLKQRTGHARLARLCFIDYDREIAMVAVREDPQSNQPEILGVGRLCRLCGTNAAEFAIIVADRWQRRGLGTLLLKKLVDIGREERVPRISGTVLAENQGMRRLCENTGFTVRHLGGGPEFEAVIEPGSPPVG